MSEQQVKFIRVFKRNIAVWLAIQFITVLFSLLGFYFNTNNELSNHSKILEENKTERMYLKERIETKMSEKMFYDYKKDQNKRLDLIIYEIRQNRKAINDK